MVGSREKENRKPVSTGYKVSMEEEEKALEKGGEDSGKSTWADLMP